MKFANDVSSLGSKVGGMASLKIEYSPYEAEWVAEVSWSSDYRIKYKDPSLYIVLSCITTKVYEKYFELQKEMDEEQ